MAERQQRHGAEASDYATAADWKRFSELAINGFEEIIALADRLGGADRTNSAAARIKVLAVALQGCAHGFGDEELETLSDAVSAGSPRAAERVDGHQAKTLDAWDALTARLTELDVMLQMIRGEGLDRLCNTGDQEAYVGRCAQASDECRGLLEAVMNLTSASAPN
jgi:hypothetical protein